MPIRKIAAKITPEAFVRFMLALAAVWFLAVHPFLNFSGWLTPGLRPFLWDFPPYYAGAVAAKHGLWEDLYPRVKTEVAQGRIQQAAVSDYSPRLLAVCPEINARDRYIYPPPLALLLWPLAYVDFQTAGAHVWPILSMAALFGMAFFSSRIHRLLRGRATYTEGWIVAAILFFTIFGHTSVAEGNATPFLGGLIAFAAYAWMRGWQTGVGAAMIPMLLFKPVGLGWCPLLLIRRPRWRTLFTLAALTALLNGAVLALGSVAVYRQFFEIMPKLTTPAGIGIAAQIFNALGVYPAKLYLALSLLLCLALYYGYWKRAVVDRYAALLAALAGTVAVYCLFSFAVWPHYFPNYLYFPFLGWLAWEGLQARGGWRTAILGGMLFGYALTCDWMVRGTLTRGFGQQYRDFYCEYFSHPLLAVFFPLFFLTVALRRLYFKSSPTAFSPPH